VVRTVSDEIDSSTFSSTSRSAIICMVQPEASAGASEQAILTIAASTSPVTFGCTGGVSRCLRSSASRGPTSQTRSRSLCIERNENPLSFTTSESDNEGAPSLQSMASMAVARWTFTAAAVRLRESFSSCSRSSASNLM